MDEQKQPSPEEEQDDVEAHGLKETVAAAAAVGAIAVPSATAYVPSASPDGSPDKLAPAAVQGKTAAKKSGKKKAAAKTSAGKTSPQKPVLQPESTGAEEPEATSAGKTSPKKPPLQPEG